MVNTASAPTPIRSAPCRIFRAAIGRSYSSAISGRVRRHCPPSVPPQRTAPQWGPPMTAMPTFCGRFTPEAWPPRKVWLPRALASRFGSGKPGHGISLRATSPNRCRTHPPSSGCTICGPIWRRSPRPEMPRSAEYWTPATPHRRRSAPSPRPSPRPGSTPTSGPRPVAPTSATPSRRC